MSRGPRSLPRRTLTGLFSRAMREQMLGTHAAETDGSAGGQLVAGIDVAGQDNALALGLMPEPSAGPRDATVITIGRVRRAAGDDPTLEVLAIFAWQGAAYEQQHALMEQLCRDTFPCARITVDATGLGAAPAAYLRRVLGSRVQPYVFSARSRSDLAYTMLGMAGGGRLKLFRDGPADLLRARTRMLREIVVVRYDTSVTESMRWSVPAAEGHDDYVTSLALC